MQTLATKTPTLIQLVSRFLTKTRFWEKNDHKARSMNHQMNGNFELNCRSKCEQSDAVEAEAQMAANGVEDIASNEESIRDDTDSILGKEYFSDSGSDDEDEFNVPYIKHWETRQNVSIKIPVTQGVEEDSDETEGEGADDEEMKNLILAILNASQSNPESDCRKTEDPETIINRLLCNGGGQMPLYINGQHTVFTFYASIDRLDVVRQAYRHQLLNSWGVGLITPSTPDIFGKTIVYYFVQADNWDALSFCFSVISDRWQVIMSALAACAHAKGRPRVFDLLLRQVQAGAADRIDERLSLERNCAWESPEVNNYTLLQLCCFYDRLDLAAYLMHFGANPLLTAGSDCYRFDSCYDICGSVSAQPAKAFKWLWAYRRANNSQIMAMRNRVMSRINLPSRRLQEFEQLLSATVLPQENSDELTRDSSRAN